MGIGPRSTRSCEYTLMNWNLGTRRSQFDSAGGHFASADALKRVGRFSEAVAEYREGLRSEPRVAAAHFALGDALEAIGDDDGAVAAYRDGLRLEPRAAIVRSNLALLLLKHGFTDEAILQLRLALDLDPFDAGTHVNLGFCLQVNGEIRKAADQFREGIRLNSRLEQAHLGLGSALYSLGEFRGAIVALEAAIHLQPDESDAHFFLAGALAACGDLVGAIAEYHRSLDLNPADPTVVQAALDLARGELELGASRRRGGQVNAKAVLADVVATLRGIPPTLSGDDSVLADAWEEIKDQLQGQLSFIWPAYLDTINGAIDAAVTKLAADDLQTLATELKAPVRNGRKIRHTLLLRLLARARKEKIRYEPFEYAFFWYSLGPLTVYNEILKRTGIHTCWVRAHSGAAPFGEQGEIDLAAIDRCTDINVMTAEEFEQARRLQWPEAASKQKEPHRI